MATVKVIGFSPLVVFIMVKIWAFFDSRELR